MTEISRKPTTRQKYAFIGLTTIGTAAILRNGIRLYKYTRSYNNLIQLIGKQSNISDVVAILDGANQQKQVLLETISPNFSNNYFSAINDPTKYQTKIGKFYSKLSFQTGFEGLFRYQGKDYRIHFNMNRPIVGFEVAHAAKEFDKSGVKFHKNQLITIFGDMKYQKELKRTVVDTKILCLDRIQIQKYWEMNIIATILSSFYFSILLGIALSLYNKSLALDENWLQQQLKQLTNDQFSKKQTITETINANEVQ